MIVFVGDLHLHETYFDYAEKWLDFLLNKISKLPNVEKIVFLGDLFENKDRIPNKLIALTTDFAYEITKICKDVYYIVGNHDIGVDGLTVSHLKYVWNVVDRIVQIDDCCFVPYHRKDLPQEFSGKYIFAHNALFVVPPRQGYLKLEKEFEVKRKKDQFFIMGHIHVPAMLDDHTMYVGSLFERDFRDGTFIYDDTNIKQVSLFRGFGFIDEDVIVPANLLHDLPFPYIHFVSFVSEKDKEDLLKDVELYLSVLSCQSPVIEAKISIRSPFDFSEKDFASISIPDNVSISGFIFHKKTVETEQRDVPLVSFNFEQIIDRVIEETEIPKGTTKTEIKKFVLNYFRKEGLL